MMHPAADSIRCVLFLLDGCLFWPVLGLLTGFGLDLLAGLLSGPTVDRARLQLVGVLLASILLPGSARA
eukprot:5471233-Amphidinium_carterae.1